jgi:uncharacterized protein YbbC (DUF1343 family)
VPVRFTPQSSVFKGSECRGINIIVTDRARFRPVLTGIEIAVALRRLNSADWRVDDYLRLLANSDALALIKRGAAPEEIVRSWASSLQEFRKARSRVLLY